MRAGVALLALALAGCAALEVRGRQLPRALAVDPAELVPPPGGKPTRAVHTFTASGLPVALVDEPGVDLVTLQVVVGCGRADDPPGQAGLTGLMLSALLRAGAGAHDAPGQRRLLRRLARFREAIDDAESWLIVTTRRGDVPELLAAVAEALRAPHFEDAELARVTQRLAGVQDEPATRLQRWTAAVRQRALFGDASPLSQLSTPQSLRALRREDVVRQHQRCVQPGTVSLGVAGALDEAALRAALEPFDGWTAGPPRTRAVAQQALGGQRVFVVPAAVTDRVQVEIVSTGLRPGTEQRAAAWVMERALEGQLFDLLRNHGGMVYGVEVDVEVGPTTGMTLVRFTTRREFAWRAAWQAMALLRQWWARWPVPDERLAEYVDSVATAWASRPAASIAQATAIAAVQGGPAVTAERLRAVQPFEVREVFSNTLRPERLQLIVSGALSKDDDWSQLGPVTYLDGPPADDAGPSVGAP